VSDKESHQTPIAREQSSAEVTEHASLYQQLDRAEEERFSRLMVRLSSVWLLILTIVLPCTFAILVTSPRDSSLSLVAAPLGF